MSLRRILWLSVTVIFVLALAACGAKPAPATAAPTVGEADDPEPDTMAEAMEIEAGQVTGSLIEDDEDWFRVNVPKGSLITVSLTPDRGAGPMSIQWLDADQYQIWSAYDVLGAADGSLLLGDTGGTHYLSIYGRPGGYTLQVEAKSQNDGGSGGDAGDEITDTLTIRPGDVVKGIVGDYDENDWYRFEVPHGSVLSVSLAAAQGAKGVSVELLNPEQYQVWGEYGVRGGKAVATAQVMSTDSGGVFYLRVCGTGEYTIEFNAAQQNDVGSGDDAGDAIQDALAIELGAEYEGLLGGEDYEDWYEVEVPAGSVVTARLAVESGSENLHIVLMDNDEYEVWSEYDVRAGKSASGSYVLSNEGGGTFYLRIHGSGGAYRFSIGAEAQDDAGSGDDAPGSISTALEIETGVVHQGQLGDHDYEDWYTFAPAVGQTICFTVESGSQNLHIVLMDDDEYEVWSEYDVRAGKSVEFEITEVENEPFYVQVHGGKGSYTLEIVEP